MGARERITLTPPKESPQWFIDHMAQLRQILERMQQQLDRHTPAFTPTNVVTTRSYDVNTVTLTQLANTLGTLLQDLKSTGITQ
jgi:hypothetical protein